MDEPFPYGLPIFRRRHVAVSPDGRFEARIDPAFEVSMSNPTSGTLDLSTGLRVPTCIPSFICSDDSRYLAVPQWQSFLFVFRRLRLLVVDVPDGRVFAARPFGWVIQPHSFSSGELVVESNPFAQTRLHRFPIPASLVDFTRVPAELDAARERGSLP